MNLPEDVILLRVFVGENDRFHHMPLYEAIVLKARQTGMAGATVLRGPMGYGKSSRLHTTKLERLSEDLPFIVEIVDSKEKADAFVPLLDEMFMTSKSSGLVTWETIKVLRYG